MVLYCQTGRRAEIARRRLQRMGYTRVVNFGGIRRWKGALQHS